MLTKRCLAYFCVVFAVGTLIAATAFLICKTRPESPIEIVAIEDKRADGRVEQVVALVHQSDLAEFQISTDDIRGLVRCAFGSMRDSFGGMIAEGLGADAITQKSHEIDLGGQEVTPDRLVKAEGLKRMLARGVCVEIRSRSGDKVMPSLRFVLGGAGQGRESLGSEEAPVKTGGE